ncbi:hypothetical protein, partial [Neisseria meningitidis]|uniref:hypothetical protein n=1 Tax=Neisseria meningitidis TaxID=487 RepID=UPI000A8B12F0
SRLRGNDGGKILFFPIIAHNLKFLHSLKNKIRTLNPIIPIYVNIKILRERVGASLRCLRQAGLAGKSGKYSGLNKSRYERTIL